MASAADPCVEATTTLDRIDCRTKQLNVEEKKQKQYFNAAVDRAALLDLNAQRLVEEQLAWEKYREALCGNVYLLWVQGSIRYEMAAACNLRLVQDRTYDLWRSYLTYLDNTPPVLPDPRQ